MIVSVCSVCGERYGAKNDGRIGVRLSHGYCKVCGAIEIAKIRAEFDKIENQEDPRGVVPTRVF
jgi:hypothetical protein